MRLPLGLEGQKYLSAGDGVSVGLTLKGQSTNLYDGYLAVVTPPGRIFYYPKFSTAPAPCATSFRVNGTIEHTETLHQINGEEAEGEYAIYFAIVPAGTRRNLQSLIKSTVAYAKNTIYVNPTVEGTVALKSSNAFVKIYDTYWGGLLGSGPIDYSGNFKIILSGRYSTPSFTSTVWIKVEASGFYTILNGHYPYTQKGLSFSLDPLPADTTLSGVLYCDAWIIGPYYVQDAVLELLLQDVVIASARSTSSGRYDFKSVPPNNYLLRVTYLDHVPGLPPTYLKKEVPVTVGEGVNYLDVDCLPSVIPMKPNIYLYPMDTQLVRVSLEFPMGGELIQSIPPYGNGWGVEVTPDGKIGGIYDYLFYESLNADTYQYEHGWCIAGDDMEAQLRDKLGLMGFRGREMDDFISYWIPRLVGSAYYLIYPQFSEDIAKSTKLVIDPPPDSLLRVFLRIIPAPIQIDIAPPHLTPFTRSGFTVVEWGVVL